jgi:hypothetical protein
MLRTRLQIAGTVVGASVMTHYWDGPSDAAHAVDVRQAIGLFGSALQTSMKSGTTLNLEPDAEVVDPTTGQITGLEPMLAYGVTGSDPGDQLPVATQGLIRWRTGVFVGGREIRGRSFIPSPTEGNNTNGKPSSSYITNVGNAAIAILSDPAAGFAIWSRANGQVAPVVSHSVWSEWSGLRSRRD